MKKTITFIMAILVSVLAQAQTGGKHLDAKQQSVALISAFTARGDLHQLKEELEKGLDNKLSINEIKEILVQMYAYCGFPRSLNALNLFMTIVEQRKEAGKNDILGKEASPIERNSDMSELGEETRTKLVGKPVTGKVYDFCPIINEYLRSHLFGDIFARDNINFQYRELATVGALAGMNMESQLRSHLSICKNLGFTEMQLRNFASLISRNIGSSEGETVNNVLSQIYK